MNKHSQYALRTFACELPAPDSPDYDEIPTPFGYARSMVDHNNGENGAALGLCTGYHQAPDHTWWDLAWVYDTTGQSGDGGDVVMCWWQQTSCPGCEGHGEYPIHDNSTDGVIGYGRCEMKHPEPPPPPVSLVKAHYCDDPYHCSPF